MFAMFAVFIGVNAMETLGNIGIFVFILLVSGSVWGIGYSLVLFFKNFEKTGKEFRRQFKNIYLRYSILVGICFFVLSYVNSIFGNFYE